MTKIFIIALAGFLLTIISLIAIDMWGLETKKKLAYATTAVLIIMGITILALVLAAKFAILETAQPLKYIA